MRSKSVKFQMSAQNFHIYFILFHSQTWPYIFQVSEMSELPFKNNSPEAPSIKYTDKKKNPLQIDDESREIQLFETFRNINMSYQKDSDTLYD